MKNRKGLSYYMGMAYRNTKRPSISIKKIEPESSPQANSELKISTSLDADKIHSRKVRNNSVKSTENNKPTSHSIPFKDREAAQLSEKKIKQQKLLKSKLIDFKDIFTVSSLDKKNVASSNRSSQKNQLSPNSKAFPLSSNLKSMKTENIDFQLRASRNDFRFIRLSTENVSIFNKSPSEIFLNPNDKLRQFFGIGKIQQKSERKKVNIKTQNFFFQKKRSLAVETKRNQHSSEKKKKSQSRNLFNFDGTLENHKIELEVHQRPKTAQVKRKTSIRSYTAIANKCITIKSKKKFSNDELHILPWNSKNDYQPDENLKDVSFSSIQESSSMKL